MDASTTIAEQIPLLQALHTQLALPPTALAEDQSRIDAAVRNAILSVVRSREDEVAQWEEKIADRKRELSAVARAVGDIGRTVVAAGRRESEQGEPLPAQHERLIRQIEELQQSYAERLEKVEHLMLELESLSLLLGMPFGAPDPLQVVPGSGSTAPTAASDVPRPSTAPQQLAVPAAGTAPTTHRKSRQSSRPPAPPEPAPVQSYFDVGEDVLDALQQQVERALAERETRLQNLETHFNDLLWYHAELDLPPAVHGTMFPLALLPSQADEEQPGFHARYERLLDHVLSVNPRQTGEDGEDGVELLGMDDIEPEIGLMNWSEAVLSLWIDEKDWRDSRIQELYEKINPLWSRLNIPQDAINAFIETNLGSGESTILAYETELERMLELRRSSLSSFVVNTRREIETLQDSLMMSDDEKARFGAFIDDDYTEELLQEHEDEAGRLRAEVEVKGPLLKRVKEWLQLKADEEELELTANDPNRFKKRGTAMLREEKLRKRVEKLKPKVEAELVSAVPVWEEEHGLPFLALGERVVESIENAAAAKEAAKEAKKRAKAGLAAGVPLAPRGTTPAPGTAQRNKRAAPAPSTATRGRVATGGSAAGAKRPRVVSATSTLGSSTASAVPRYAHSAMATPTAYAASRTAAAGARAFGKPAVGARANASAAARAPPPSYSTGTAKVRTVGGTAPRAGGAGAGVGAGAAVAKVKSVRRESFRPRPSLAGTLLAERSGLLAGLAEEDYDDDVF